MRLRSVALCLAVLPLLHAPDARAQVEVTVTMPVIRFETAPALVYVSPGIQVVPEYDDEVFYVRGSYWARRGDRWYRSGSHSGQWVYMQTGVPSGLRTISPGKYRHYRAPAPVPVRPRVEQRSRDDDRGRDHNRGEKRHDGRGNGKGKDRGRGK